MINRKAIVKIVVALLHEPHFNVSKATMTDVKGARDANGLNEATQSAALFIFNLLLDPIGDILPVSVLLFPSLDGQLHTITVQSMLVQLTVVVIDPIAHLILQCQPNNITRHVRHCNIYVYVELVGVV